MSYSPGPGPRPKMSSKKPPPRENRKTLSGGVSLWESALSFSRHGFTHYRPASLRAGRVSLFNSLSPSGGAGHKSFWASRCV